MSALISADRALAAALDVLKSLVSLKTSIGSVPFVIEGQSPSRFPL